jgi:hypothetical protein
MGRRMVNRSCADGERLRVGWWDATRDDEAVTDGSPADGVGERKGRSQGLKPAWIRGWIAGTEVPAYLRSKSPGDLRSRGEGVVSRGGDFGLWDPPVTMSP